MSTLLQKSSKKSLIREYGEALLVALVLAFVIRTFVVQAYKIPSESMVETLLVGDHLLASKFAYGIKIPFTHSYIYRGDDPAYGDIIIFEYPNDPSVDYIKRVIGLPGDVITSFSGQTIEILNADAEGRLILADALAWAAEKEGCTHLVDIATLTGAIWSMLGFVTTGVMASDDGFYDCLTRAAARSGEKFWRMPDDAEYEKLIESDYADVRNTSKDGCGAITAGLFLKKFTAKRPWLHLDIAGTADNTGIVWQHQVPGATGTAVSTLYHLSQVLFETKEEPACIHP